MNAQHKRFYHITKRTAAILLLVIIAVIVAVIYASNAYAHRVYIEPISPSEGAAIGKEVQLSSKVYGAAPHEYEMFWAVGNGQWNRMTTSSDSGISTAKIDATGWNWANNNAYQIRFIALIKSTQQSIEKSVTIHKSEGATSSRAPESRQPSFDSPLYTSPNTTASHQNREARSQALEYIAAQPTAQWFGGWNTDVTADVSSYIQQAKAARATPVLVLYNIPQRDCGSHSKGGVMSHDEYRRWVKSVANGLQGHAAIVIIEPDALASMGCLSEKEKVERRHAIKDAVATLATPGVKTYIDAGHPQWKSPSQITTELKAAGIDKATGFSLNVSNFRTTKSNIDYGTKISKLVGNKTFVIDTSRNGKGPAPDGEWCNPAERGLGRVPTSSTDNKLVDAYLWVKAPGESDGACGRGAPAAGQWWQEYAEQLYTNRAQ